MNKKGLELAISTIVIVVISVAVLIGLILFLRGGFEAISSGTNPLLDTVEGMAIKEACELTCAIENRLVYCCKEFDYGDEKLFCMDSRLEIGCDLDCEDFICE
tara:strand:- start:189 stop:497 length:309 start_codon:yes stop_codon:yes gene_type:complete